MAELLNIFFNIMAPVFILVLIGYVVGPRLGLDARSLGRYAYFILTPAFVFEQLRLVEIGLGLVVRMSLCMLTVEVCCALLAFVVARGLLRRSAKMTAVYVSAAAFGNVGNFGFPIIQFALGEDALGAATIYFLVVLVVSFIIGVGAASWVEGGGFGAVLAVLKTPGVMVVPLAMVVNWFQLDLPLTLSRPIGLLAEALVPTMLVTLGVQLASAGIPRPDLDMVMAGAVRLVGSPLIALGLVPFFALGSLERDVGILQASMPVAVLVSMIALEHDMLPTFVTALVLFSTLVSIVTLTTVIALL
jgi:hypothetical protein